MLPYRSVAEGVGCTAKLVLADTTRAHVVAQRVDLSPANSCRIDLEQDVRTALKVETQHDMALCPFRPTVDSVLCEKKFGIANEQMISVVAMIAHIFQREI